MTSSKEGAKFQEWFPPKGTSFTKLKKTYEDYRKLQAWTFAPLEGTFADKPFGLEWQPASKEDGYIWPVEKARETCMRENTITKPVFAYSIDGGYYIGGWCRTEK